MSGETKNKIAAVALRLFSQNGYPGTSMSDIAVQLGITKPALYKHYTSKHDILEGIVKRMSDMDCERAGKYGMPGDVTDEAADAYMNTPTEKIRAYSIAQFRHWTEDEFSARFRRMLTVEQYRDAEMARLYQKYLAAGPAEYMAAIFRQMTETDDEATQLALDFYGPMFLLYSVYDGAEDKKAVIGMLGSHIDRFISRMNDMKETTK